MRVHYIHYPTGEARSGIFVRTLRGKYNSCVVRMDDGREVVVHYSNIFTKRVEAWKQTMIELLSLPGNLEYVLLIGRP